jgi:hypothetical protein
MVGLLEFSHRRVVWLGEAACMKGNGWIYCFFRHMMMDGYKLRMGYSQQMRCLFE